MALTRRARRAHAHARSLAALRADPADRGRGGHDAYFAGLAAALARAGVAEPAMVVDRDRLLANIETIRAALAPSGLALRIVSKSLQAPALLDLVLDRARTRRLMVFNGLMLDEMLRVQPDSDVLLGRPLPAAQVGRFVERHHANAAPAAHPQWLVDTPARLAQYAAIARANGTPLRVSLEIDVGLHRGGLPDPRALAEVIDLAAADPLIEIAGLMGYDAHAAGAVDPPAAIQAGKDRYAEFVGVLLARLGRAPEAYTLNAAGSPTFMGHIGRSPANEVSVGSAFVKPLNFDYPALHELQPACFIVQPVLKVMRPAMIPSWEPAAVALAELNPNAAQGIFVYGGYGDGEPVSPAGLSFHPLYGARSMLMGSHAVSIAPDDLVFFRPRESEGSFLQYGDILVYDGAEIADRWPTFPAHA